MFESLRVFSIALVAVLGPTQTDAISRPYTVLNERTIQSESLSRTSTVLNMRTPTPSEAHSRASTILNRIFPKAGESHSRAETVLNSRAAIAPEAISRSITLCDVGDFNLNGELDHGDIELFIVALLNPDADANHGWGADMNCDFNSDGLDIQAFVDAILN
jgi:hypothetical protein